ncbi:GGDEF domain-containing protein [Vibrio sp. SCSIO 43136]|uniref:GGDEF domain-containing protein n=1 Tax=Vibrio sp. SCSIO 43136 TaxID=2819101 RepID=UPI00207580F2|nr:GGDEF domain-containing protein [Vibrio sp. SCSIO 43136]USD63991.1 GGDEF domain-containing protein [Vibrio sp. SCSIO 43136]
MIGQTAIVLAALIVTLFGLAASFLINEPEEPRRAKPYYMAFYISTLFFFYLHGRIPEFQTELEPKLLDATFAIGFSGLSIGTAIRCKNPLAEKITIFLLSAFLVLVFSGYIFTSHSLLFMGSQIFLMSWSLSKKQLGVNKADFGFIFTMMCSFTLMALDGRSATDYHSMEEYFNFHLIYEFIFAPALVSGISVFLLTSYMLDSNALLQRLATKDALTDMLNRRALFEHISDQLNYLARKDKPAAIILADIDHFKSINDTHGHDAGDIALKQFADIIRDRVRDYDIAARYGGEEFLIFLPNAHQDIAASVAERIRLECETTTIDYQGKSIQFTVSFGVSAYNFERDISDNIIRADEALYKAKDSGRNQVTVARLDPVF